MKRLRGKLTYANVTATLALFLVIAGGSAFAASKLAKNSVGAKQIKNQAITTARARLTPQAPTTRLTPQAPTTRPTRQAPKPRLMPSAPPTRPS